MGDVAAEVLRHTPRVRGVGDEGRVCATNPTSSRFLHIPWNDIQLYGIRLGHWCNDIWLYVISLYARAAAP